MKVLRALISLAGVFLLGGCDYFHMGFPMQTQSSQSGFSCGGAGAVVQVTSGTDSYPGAATLQNFNNGKTSSRTIDALASTGGAATVIFLTCGDVGLKCNLQGFDSVKICGGTGVWQLTTGQITITNTPFTSG